MRKTGYIIISVGFLAGALAAVFDESEVQWGYFIGALVLGILGVVMVRWHTHKDSFSEEKLAMNLQDIKTSLAHIVKNITRLNAEKESINAYEMRHRIDELFAGDITTFVEARESFAQVHGLQSYADVMSHFASGERYLNRIWSASADGYVDEIMTYLDKAQMQFTEAFERVNRLKELTD